MQIIDNFLSDAEYQSIKDVITSTYFPWYAAYAVTSLNDDYTQFVHTFYRENKPNSSHYDDLLPIIDKLNPCSLLRVKANLLTKTQEHIQHEFHVDYTYTNQEYMTGIYYVNTNNGYTLFEDGSKVNSVANRFVAFDPSLPHASVTQTDEKFRWVINFNWIGLR